MSKKYKIISIDAWAGMEKGEWDWNQWFNVGEIEKIPDSNRKLLKFFRDEGYLTENSKGKVGVNDDGYNIVIFVRSNGRPLFAIEYGNHI